MVNSDKNSSFYIGASGSKSFGRGDTINNLHLSEFAFYEDPESMLASVLQAVVPQGKVIVESTANGMNYLKTFWDKAKAGENNFTPHFFDNSFYSREFLEEKKKELGEELFKQEYPANDLEAFLSSGDLFFDKQALSWYLKNVKEPIQSVNSYYDLPI
jgi:phage FluMu gp28-like protein